MHAFPSHMLAEMCSKFYIQRLIQNLPPSYGQLNYFSLVEIEAYHEHAYLPLNDINFCNTFHIHCE